MSSQGAAVKICDVLYQNWPTNVTSNYGCGKPHQYWAITILPLTVRTLPASKKDTGPSPECLLGIIIAFVVKQKQMGAIIFTHLKNWAVEIVFVLKKET